MDDSELVDLHIASGTREIPSVDRSATREPPSSPLLLASFDEAPQTKDEISAGPHLPGSKLPAPPKVQSPSGRFSENPGLLFPGIERLGTVLHCNRSLSKIQGTIRSIGITPSDTGSRGQL